MQITEHRGIASAVRLHVALSGLYKSDVIHSFIQFTVEHQGMANATCPHVTSSGLYQSVVIHSFIQPLVMKE
jgi:hypothetical protein